jgi:lantibiotic biosynthesis protein
VWRPILMGALARSAQASVIEVLEALTPGKGRPGSATLSDGAAGMALLFGYAAATGAFPEGKAGADAHLAHATEALSETALPSGLFTGFAGVAFALQHLDRMAGELPEDDDALSEIDEALLGFVGQSPWKGDHDLVLGLTGIGLYALERLPRSLGRRCLSEVVLRLTELPRRK